MRIGIDALFEDATSGTGGLTYLRNVIREIGEVGEDDQFFVFVPDSDAVQTFSCGYHNVEFLPCLKRSHASVARVFAQHCTMAILARKLKLDVLLCPGNICSIFSPVPVVLVSQNRLQYVGLNSKQYSLQPVGVVRALYKNIVGRVSLKKAKMILPVSKDLRDFLVNVLKVPSSKTKVIPLGVDRNRFQASRLNAEERGFPSEGYILNVSRLLPSKNQDTLIRAFGAYCGSRGSSSERLVIVGNDFRGQKERLVKLSEKLCLSHRVALVDFIPYDEIPIIYQRASLFIHLSYAEAFPLPVLEAMASGVPVIVSNTTGLSEIVGDAGLVVDPDNLDEIVAAIRLLLTDASLRRTFTKKGLARVKEMSWSRTAQETLGVLHTVVLR